MSNVSRKRKAPEREKKNPYVTNTEAYHRTNISLSDNNVNNK